VDALSDRLRARRRHRYGGDASLAKLERKHGTLPVTRRRRTGGGGMHVYFAPPPNVIIKNSVGKMAAGSISAAQVVTVMAPPSRHVSGSLSGTPVTPMRRCRDGSPRPRRSISTGRCGTGRTLISWMQSLSDWGPEGADLFSLSFLHSLDSQRSAAEAEYITSNGCLTPKFRVEHAPV
jgi:hypothetical protein